MNLEKVFTSKAIDRTAALVTSRSSDNYEYKSNGKYWNARKPVPMSRHMESVKQRDNLKKKRFGNLLVIGLMRAPYKRDIAIWVVKCACGAYDGRMAKSLKEGNATCCDRCVRMRQMRKGNKTRANYVQEEAKEDW